MTASDLLLALGPVVDELEAMGVRYYVGGSLASLAHGVPRASIDADVVADLGEANVERLVARLQGDYYIDLLERARQECPRTRRGRALRLTDSCARSSLVAGLPGPVFALR